MRIFFALIVTFVLLISYQNCASEIDIEALKQQASNSSSDRNSNSNDNSDSDSGNNGGSGNDDSGSDDSGSGNSGGDSGDDEGDDGNGTGDGGSNNNDDEIVPDYSGFQVILPSQSPRESETVQISLTPYDARYAVKFYLSGCGYSRAVALAGVPSASGYNLSVNCDTVANIEVRADIVSSSNTNQQLYSFYDPQILSFLAIDVEALPTGISISQDSISKNVFDEFILDISVESQLLNDEDYEFSLDNITGCNLITNLRGNSGAYRLSCSEVLSNRSIVARASSRRYTASDSVSINISKIPLNIDIVSSVEGNRYRIGQNANTILSYTGVGNYSNRFSSSDVKWSLGSSESGCNPSSETKTLGSCSITDGSNGIGLSCSDRSASSLFVCMSINNDEVTGSVKEQFFIDKQEVAVSISGFDSANYVDTNYVLTASVTGLPNGVDEDDLEFSWSLCSSSSQLGSSPSRYTDGENSKTAKCSSTGTKYFYVSVRGESVQGEAEVSKFIDEIPYSYVVQFQREISGYDLASRSCTNTDRNIQCNGPDDKGKTTGLCCNGTIRRICENVIIDLGAGAVSESLLDSQAGANLRRDCDAYVNVCVPDTSDEAGVGKYVCKEVEN